jgi:hypothetical protein
MSNVIKLLAGAQSSYAAAGFTGTDFNSLADGSVAVATSSIDNSTNLDLLLEVSFSLVVGGTTTANSYLGLYLLPLNQDGSTYGDSITTGSTLPVPSYWRTNSFAKSGVTSGNAIVGAFPVILMPRSSFRLAVSNRLGVALNASAAASVQYKTSNYNGNG